MRKPVNIRAPSRIVLRTSNCAATTLGSHYTQRNLKRNFQILFYISIIISRPTDVTKTEKTGRGHTL